MRPRIGITSWHRNDADHLERWTAIQETYTGAVRTAGGLPLVFPILDDEPETIEAYLAAVDGLIFSGGEDIAPAYYGEPRDERCHEPDPERDLFEINLARAALERQVPTLGICRGLQVINVAAGGTLYQDIACRPGTWGYHSASAADRVRPIHGVRLVPRSRLAAVMGVVECHVTSTHHQFVKDLAPGFRVAAESVEDGIVEGMEHPDHGFAVAVQWHPERLYRSDPAHLALFAALVVAARDAAKKQTA
ncbi:MAG: gamma-glutamyl-gamma-aminobutyrate hydrolase family protein [Zetaproteobacteria bacterium]|nr:MAG: gamma-glutamyl-gamma-aminobutyrate hydrolase family protein [Zetaproteobacteria bacterium]